MKMKFYQKVLILPVLVLLWSALVPCVAASGEDSFIIPQTKLTNSEDEPGGGKFGSSVAIDGSTLGVGAILADGGADSSGAAYLFRITDSNDFPQIKLTESDDPHNYDYFGNSLDIRGDALVIGASRDDINGTDSGAAYVMRFSYDEGTWTISKQTRLTPTEPSAADQFGYSVAISDNRVVVGTYKAEAVYVFDDNGSGWDEKAKLTAGDAQGGEKFGSSVAIDGDTLVVGAIKGGNGNAQTGSAYVFHYDGYAWVEEAKLMAADLGDSDKFGYSVAIEGDTIIVGAPYHDAGESNSGAAYVFRLNAGHWLEVAKLTGSELFENAYFGNSVALSGNTAVVGAYKNDLLDQDNNLLADAGSAHLFRFDGSGWPEKEKLIPSDVEAGDEFGCAVAISGDTVVVGAHKEGDLAGSAYIFTLALENQPPVANAGENVEVEEGDLVVLDGSLSEDPDGVILTYEWVQKLTDDEPLVELDLSNSVYPTFIAPALNPKCATFTFELRVTDDKGLTSEPAKVEVKVLPNNRIYSKLRGKHPRWPTWHKYTFEGFKDEVITITLEADPSGWNHGKGVTLMLKDKIWGVWFREAARGDLPKTLTAKLPADGQYAVYVVKKPWFRRGNSFSGDYILTVEGTCGKLRKSSW